MLQILNIIIPLLAILMLSACEQSDQNVANKKMDTSPIFHQAEAPGAPILAAPALTAPPEQTYKTVEWIDLMPKDDLDALMNPPAYLTDIEDGSFEDQITSQFKNIPPADKDDPYQRALISTDIIQEMNGQAIRIPGFVVPLEFESAEIITQFFLVPFFGACIHLPPPPPNQIIFVNYPKGFKLSALYDPFWISGILKTSLVENDMAKAAYTLQMHSFEEYSE